MVCACSNGTHRNGSQSLQHQFWELRARKGDAETFRKHDNRLRFVQGIWFGIHLKACIAPNCQLGGLFEACGLFLGGERHTRPLLVQVHVLTSARPVDVYILLTKRLRVVGIMCVRWVLCCNHVPET